MNNNRKKIVIFLVVMIAASILIAVGATFAYFSATIASDNAAVSTSSAIFELKLEDDTSLIKTNMIPSIVDYVDISLKRFDEFGNFLKPPEGAKTGDDSTIGTTCIDDNKNEICSVYTFTIINEMENQDVPIVVTLDPVINSFENLYIKILDEDKNEVVNSVMHLIDDRYELDEDGNYQKDADGNLIEKENFSELPMPSYTLDSITQTLLKATKDTESGELIPTKLTYTIVMWINETHQDQTKEDSGKAFAAGITVRASGADGNGIRGVISTAGTE